MSQTGVSSKEEIPEKLYFKIGEVSDIIGVKPYVLRYWETEFKEISPVKSRTNQRLYKRKDVELVLRIRDLLYKEGFTISGAKTKLKSESKDEAQQNEQLNFSLTHEDNYEVRVGSKQLVQIKSQLHGLLDDMAKVLKA